jgi:hypothetical protein
MREEFRTRKKKLSEIFSSFQFLVLLQSVHIPKITEKRKKRKIKRRRIEDIFRGVVKYSQDILIFSHHSFTLHHCNPYAKAHRVFQSNNKKKLKLFFSYSKYSSSTQVLKKKQFFIKFFVFTNILSLSLVLLIN